MAQARHPSRAAVSELRPALRTDLTLVYDNPETAGGGLRIIDQKSGRQYSFDRDEQHLCRIADGTTDISGLHAKLRAEGGSLSLNEVTRFFRRLRVLGLLQPLPTASDTPLDTGGAAARSGDVQPQANKTTGRRDPRELLRRRREELERRPSEAPQPPSKDRGDTEARRELVLRRLRERREGRPEAIGTSADTPRRADTSRVASDPAPGADNPAALTDPAGNAAKTPARPKARAGGATAREKALGPAPEASGSDRPEPAGTKDGAASATTETSPDSTIAKAGNEAPRRKASAGTPRAPAAVTYVKRETPSASDAPDSMIRRLRERPNRGIAPRTGVRADGVEAKRRPARRRRAAPEAETDQPPAESPRPGRASDLVARRLSERASQPEAGAASASVTTRPAQERSEPDFDFMPDGLEGPGGMAGGFARGMRPGMMGAGMRGGMMGQGRRGRGMPQGQAQAERMPARLPLFDPQALFRLLYVLGYPLKYFLWVVFPLAILAGLTLLNNTDALRADIAAAASDVASAAALILGLFVVNLCTRIAQGVAIVSHGGRVKMLGFGLVMGVIPRFVIDRSAIGQLDRSGQLWSYGSVLLARLGIFAVGTLVWAITREQGGQLSLLALLASQTALTIFLVTAFPLVPSEGQRWLGVMLDEPRLMPKMLMSLKHLFRGGPLPPILSKQDVVPLAMFGIATILTSLAILGVIMAAALIWLEQELDGLGVLLFLGGLTSFLLWFRAVLRQKRRRGVNFDVAAFREIAPEPGAGGAVSAPDSPEDAQAGLSGRAKVFWALVLAGFVAVAFLPYDYYAGGQVEILPAARGQAVARTDGEIVEILVREGSEVRAGEVVARLSSWDQESDVSVNEARLAGAQANLARLRAGAKTEEVALARRRLEAAEKDVTFFSAEAERARELVKSGTISTATLEKAESDLATRLAELEVAKANLELVESPPTSEEIAVAQAEVDRLDRELTFARGELERTRIVAPVDGRVVTGNLQLRLGSYLRSGDVLLEIEQSDKVQAEIRVPEADIALISLGDTVRLKTWGKAEQEVLGTVETIAPAAEDEAYGSVVRVGAIFANEDKFLRSGMTGYAKIFGGEMRVWEAYLRSIRRFVQVEVWSWFP